MIKETIERLEHLKATLEKVQDKLEAQDRSRAFYMSLWGMDAVQGASALTYGECGFAGCAIGWYLKENPDLPLRFRSGTPVFAGREGFIAVERYFGLSDEQARYLFSGEYYPRTPERNVADPTIEEVLARIEKAITNLKKVQDDPCYAMDDQFSVVPKW